LESDLAVSTPTAGMVAKPTEQTGFDGGCGASSGEDIRTGKNQTAGPGIDDANHPVPDNQLAGSMSNSSAIGSFFPLQRFLLTC